MYDKKGAMFGLDARIALAIFGALSVISGAALYSAIQNSKVVSLISDLSEVTKAVEAYALDVGSLPVLSSSKFEIGELLADINTVKGWNGPYLSYEQCNGDATCLNHPSYTTLQIREYVDADFGGKQGVDQVSPAVCTSTNCFLYVVQYGLTPGFADAIDEYIDNTKDRKTGKVRVSVDSSNNASVFIKEFSILSFK
ncbi:MAG TPA: hypothetical protein DCL21_03115 [Alphaproteobacteria bacterium]|nr:hypothetical protein [Alphaproteobacteria bacterium]